MKLSLRGFFLMATIVGCATGSGSAATAARDRDVLAMEEIRRASATNAFDLVKSLRPNWLNTRGVDSFRESARAQGTRGQVTPGIDVLIIYLDNARLGGEETLRQIAVPTVTSLQYFDAKSATYKWGPGHTHGAILVSTAPPGVLPPR